MSKPTKTAKETLDEHCERLRAMADCPGSFVRHLTAADKKSIAAVLESHEKLLSDMHKIRRTIGG